jgi:hypothetical protein
VGWRWADALRALHRHGLSYEEQTEGVRTALAAAAAISSSSATETQDGERPMNVPGTKQYTTSGVVRAATPTPDDRDREDPCCERERELRDERVRTAHFHVAHDGTVRHPTTCNDCRRLEEQQRAGLRASGGTEG